MSSKTKVSKQVRITQGDQVITFELAKGGLAVEIDEHSAPKASFVLRKSAMDALRELLGMQQPSRAKALTPDKPLTLPAEEFDKRFKHGDKTGPPREPDGTPTPDGLNRKADGVEEGMGE